jgi:hypothetical protein
MNFRLQFIDGSVRDVPLGVSSGSAFFSRGDFCSGVASLSLHDARFTAKSGDGGFFLVPSFAYNHDSVITEFRERVDTETAFRHNDMPLYAVGKDGQAILAVVSGMSAEYELVVGVKAGKYYMYPRFLLECGAYEDICIHFFHLRGKAATLAGLARRYRQYQLERKACRTLRERVAEQPVLAKSLEGPEIRMRMGWKPMPPEILEQSEDKQPAFHTAMTFKRGEDVIEEFMRQGIDHAEFCLVGWNKGGHDGQYPDLLPVEEKLGGEEALKSLTRKAAASGYLIGAHSNLLDSYTSAKRWRREDMIEDQDGETVKGGKWCGGQSYFICPKAACQHLLDEDMETVAQLGFNGTHYFDVFTIAPPIPCHNPKHPLNRKEAGQWRGKMLAEARRRLGASASEGRLDFAIDSFDYVLFAVYGGLEAKYPDICDRPFPFWHIVYHGIVHYNAYSITVNAPLKNKMLPLLNLALGGRPLFYYYSKFRAVSPWGDEDLVCNTDEELRQGVEFIRADYERYRQVRDLQYEFIEDIEELAENVWLTTYGNGVQTLVNATEKPFKWDADKNAAPFSLTRM